MRRLRPCAYLAVAVAVALAGCAATREGGRSLFQWTDDAGNVRYTAFPEEIPRAQAHTRQLVSPPAFARRSAPAPPSIEVVDETVAVVEQPGGVVEERVEVVEERIDVAASAPAQPPAAPPAREPAPPATPADPLEARIAELEARIATEQEALKVLISDPKTAEDLRGSAELREIADRLPVLQRELDELRSQQAKATGAAAGGETSPPETAGAAGGEAKPPEAASSE